MQSTRLRNFSAPARARASPGARLSGGDNEMDGGWTHPAHWARGCCCSMRYRRFGAGDREKLGDLIRTLRAKGFTVVLSSENFRVCGASGSRFYVMESGPHSSNQSSDPNSIRKWGCFANIWAFESNIEAGRLNQNIEENQTSKRGRQDDAQNNDRSARSRFSASMHGRSGRRGRPDRHGDIDDLSGIYPRRPCRAFFCPVIDA